MCEEVSEEHKNDDDSLKRGVDPDNLTSWNAYAL